MMHFSDVQITILLIWIAACTVGLVLLYSVIYLAVRNALRSDARWEYEGGVAGEDRRAIGG